MKRQPGKSLTSKHPRTQAERRWRTQSAILDAALEVLTEEGYAGFSTNGVATRAGVSRGAQEHYYPKRIDLIVAATQHAMDQAISHARQMTASREGGRDPIDCFLASSEAFFFTPGFMALTEIGIAARSDQQLSKSFHPIVKEARVILDDIWTQTLVHSGYSANNVREFIELSHYIFRGLFYVSAWTPFDQQRDDVLARWRKLATSILGERTSTPETIST